MAARLRPLIRSCGVQGLPMGHDHHQEHLTAQRVEQIIEGAAGKLRAVATRDARNTAQQRSRPRASMRERGAAPSDNLVAGDEDGHSWAIAREDIGELGTGQGRPHLRGRKEAHLHVELGLFALAGTDRRFYHR